MAVARQMEGQVCMHVPTLTRIKRLRMPLTVLRSVHRLISANLVQAHWSNQVWVYQGTQMSYANAQVT